MNKLLFCIIIIWSGFSCEKESKSHQQLRVFCNVVDKIDGKDTNNKIKEYIGPDAWGNDIVIENKEFLMYYEHDPDFKFYSKKIYLISKGENQKRDVVIDGDINDEDLLGDDIIIEIEPTQEFNIWVLCYKRCHIRCPD